MMREMYRCVCGGCVKGDVRRLCALLASEIPDNVGMNISREMTPRQDLGFAEERVRP